MSTTTTSTTTTTTTTRDRADRYGPIEWAQSYGCCGTCVQIGALKILREMCTNKRVCLTMKQFGGTTCLIDLLQDTDKQVQGMAAEVISQLSRLSAVRRMLRVQHGIKRLVSADIDVVSGLRVLLSRLFNYREVV